MSPGALRRTIAAGLLLFFALAVGCDINRKQTEQAVKHIESQVNDLSRSVGEFVANTDAPEELKKLQQFEYHSETVPLQIPASELTERLNTLGKDRWECFATERRPATGATAAASQETIPEQLLILCKRRPATPLRYIPRTLIGVGQ